MQAALSARERAKLAREEAARFKEQMEQAEQRVSLCKVAWSHAVERAQAFEAEHAREQAATAAQGAQ